jgi:hypothetical protein
MADVWRRYNMQRLNRDGVALPYEEAGRGDPPRTPVTSLPYVPVNVYRAGARGRD